MDQIDLFTQGGEEHGVRRGRIAAADNRHRLAAVKRAIARRAIGNALAAQHGLIRQAEKARRRAGRKDHAFCAQRPVLRVQKLDFALHAQGLDLRVILLHAELLGLRLHIHRQGKAVGYAGKARVIFNFICGCHLSAGRELFKHQRIEAGTAAVQRRGKAGRARADDDDIVYFIQIRFHTTASFLLCIALISVLVLAYPLQNGRCVVGFSIAYTRRYDNSFLCTGCGNPCGAREKDPLHQNNAFL